ncbi:MAG TPA: helix-turn-helix transcriptional regulator [Streptosporangiaceae bacterium]|nr:helix-turn-helix transcriptional regulator [Streptosporangiaceae bacterium]
MPEKRQTPTVRLRRLAAELRSLRTAAGLTREAVVESTGINAATLYRIEHARVRPQTRTLRTLLDLYGVEKDQQDELVALLRDARERGWLQAYQSGLPGQYSTFIGLEGEAESEWNYESLLIPGLLQTTDYARAVISGGQPFLSREEVGQRVEVRMERQGVLHSDHPLSLWAIADEAALRRQVGNSSVMRKQIRHLLDMSELPNVTLQVIPFNAGAHPGQTGSFIAVQYEASIPDVVYIESLAGDLFLEEESQVRRYKLIFEHLRAVSASPDASRALMESLAAEK